MTNRRNPVLTLRRPELYYLNKRKESRLEALKRRKAAIPQRGYEPNDFQVFPFEKNFAQKIGLKENEKILILAGYSGNWAQRLSETNEVTFTDASEIWVKKSKEKGYPKTAHARLAEIIPQRPNIYDWSFSYEPIPILNRALYGFGATPFFVRPLLNKKGGIFVFSSQQSNHIPEFKQIIRKICAVYGANVEIKYIEMLAYYEKELRDEHFTVVKLITNKEAREKAKIDFFILNTIDRRIAKGKKPPTIKGLIKFLEKKGIKKEKTLKSISRIKKFLVNEKKHY